MLTNSKGIAAMNEQCLPFQDALLDVEQRVDDLIGRLSVEEKVSQLLDVSPGIERLGIPPYCWWNECLHGVARAGRATVFPQSIGLAAAFDVDLIYRMASSIADEGRAKHHAAAKAGNFGKYRGLTFWSPNINIFRDPRWGRGHETYGEDPYLTGELGVAFVRGLQGDDPRYLKAAACAKHYAVHSGPEGLRHEFDAVVSKKDMFETYLPAFKKLVDSGVESVMGAYNCVNGEPACASDELMSILRQEWGFKGHFVSDCGALRDFHQWHHITSSPEESASLALEKGCDLNCGCTYKYLLKAFDQGMVKEEWIDRSLRRLLRTRFKLGLLDKTQDYAYAAIPTDCIDCDEHHQLAKEAAVKSIVLLKNTPGTLPIGKKVKQLFVIGHNAASIEALLGNYYGVSGSMTTALEGIVKRAPADVTVEYRCGSLLDRDCPNSPNWAGYEFETYDMIVAVVGLSHLYEGEEGAMLSPNRGDRKSIRLPDNQIEFLNAMFETKLPVVVVVMAGSAVDLRQISEKAAAILYCWYPGAEGGNALAEILFGDVSPSGRLPITLYKSDDDLPDFEDYRMEGRTYRYLQKEPLYGFGYGLSYTRFQYSELTISPASIAPDRTVSVQATVANVGERDGDEVVQLYLSTPESGAGGPLLSLKGFERIALAKGQSKTVSFTLDGEAMGVCDDKGQKRVVPGSYTVYVGGGQPRKGRTKDDAVLAGVFEVA